jgi:5-keto 4-deoxyuronate isomerase
MCDGNILQVYIPTVNQICQMIFQMTVIAPDSGSDVGCHYQDSRMEKAIMFLVLLTVLVTVSVVRV